MPYILLIIGLLIGAYALYRFFINASIAQIKALFLAAGIATLVIALFYMAVTGKLAAALGLGAALIPFVIAYLRERRAADTPSTPHFSKGDKIESREDALAVLGLDNNADEKQINSAYKNLMQKFHPDHEGSEWIAAKLNEARDLLLKKD